MIVGSQRSNACVTHNLYVSNCTYIINKVALWPQLLLSIQTLDTVHINVCAVHCLRPAKLTHHNRMYSNYNCKKIFPSLNFFFFPKNCYCRHNSFSSATWFCESLCVFPSHVGHAVVPLISMQC